MNTISAHFLSRVFLMLLAAGITFPISASAQSAQQNALNLAIGFNGPSVQFPYMDTFYSASEAYYQSLGLSMPGVRYCHAYLTWDIAEQAVGSGASGSEGSRSWFENWLAGAVGHCDRALVTFQYQANITTHDLNAYPSASDYETAIEAFLNTDWSYTGWTGTIDFTPWNEPNNGASSGAGLTTVINAHLAADYYLALRKHCDPANGCTVAAGDFGSNGTLGTGYVQKCTDDVTSLCSNATYMDQYKYYLVNDAPNYGFTTSFRPEIFTYHGWDDVNNYINQSGCTSLTNTSCTAYVLVASLSDSTWANTILWDSEVASGQSGASSPGPYMQACAAAFLFRLTGTASNRFQRMYYTQPYVSSGQYFSLFTAAGVEKPAFAVVADRSTTYSPADGALCPGDQETTTLSLSTNQSAPVYGNSITITATLSPYTANTIVYNSANLKSGQTASNPATDKETAVSTDGEEVTFSAGGTTLGTGTLSSSVASLTMSTLPAGTDSITASYPGDSSFDATTGTLSQTVLPATLTISANNATRVYGTTNPTFSGSVTGAESGDTFTESFTTSATATSNVGTYAIVPGVVGANLANYSINVQNGTLAITQAGTTTTLSASSTSTTPGQNVMLTAAVTSSTTGTPTGSVNFYDGSTLLGTIALSSGSAVFTTSALSAGTTNQLMAVYGGDNNFSGSSSSSTSIAIASLDFSVAAMAPSSQTVVPGSAVSYRLTVTPFYGNYPGVVTFTASGLPAGATTTFNPSSIAANGGQQTVTMTIQAASATAALQPRSAIGRNYRPLVLASLFLPLLGLRRVGRNGRRLSRISCVLLLLLCSAAAFMMNGCGGGFFGQTPQNYTVTVTAASGGLQHSTTVTLNVQ